MVEDRSRPRSYPYSTDLPAPAEESQRKSRRSEASRLFDELNRRYWRGRLPRYRVIRRALLPRFLGTCSDETQTILVDSSLAGEMLRLTLLHEMCHIGTDKGYSHGPVFLRKLRRIERLGEPKLLSEVEQYDGTDAARRIAAARAAGTLGGEMSFREAVWSDLDGLAFSGRALPRWRTVRRRLSETYGVAPSDVDRLGARKEWLRLCRYARAIRRAQKLMRHREEHPESRVGCPACTSVERFLVRARRSLTLPVGERRRNPTWDL